MKDTWYPPALRPVTLGQAQVSYQVKPKITRSAVAKNGLVCYSLPFEAGRFDSDESLFTLSALV